MRGFRLVGTAGSLATALDRIHVACEVLGVEEREHELAVWLADASPGLPCLPEVVVSSLTLPEVAASGLEHDQPIVVADGLLVRPPWVQAPPGFTGTELVVPRGMAFGSGEHESTQLALRLLHTRLPRSGSVADIGTGSGILALYARQRGCRLILACDLERDAARAAHQLLPGARVLCGGPESVAATFDHVIANLQASELHSCLPDLLRLWNGRGLLVLSGMRPAEVPSILTRLPRAPAWTERGRDFTAVALA